MIKIWRIILFIFGAAVFWIGLKLSVFLLMLYHPESFGNIGLGIIALAPGLMILGIIGVIIAIIGLTLILLAIFKKK
ncbi:hypothetical protein M1513_01690 [Patescibacteria group bacterium]|nr:hypothetical protein [Patescibacteria group bacterium]MCL5733323.1 hypothetical protein [Patescibacteria group bacterium]